MNETISWDCLGGGSRRGRISGRRIYLPVRITITPAMVEEERSLSRPVTEGSGGQLANPDRFGVS